MANRRPRDVTSRNAVLAALAEFDEKGRQAFLSEYGYGEASEYAVVHESRRYDPKPILGVAYAKQYPDELPLRPQEFSGGLETTAVFERLGFQTVGGAREVVGRSPAALSVREPLEEVLATYGEARHSEAFGRQSPVWQTFEALATAFRVAPAVASRGTVNVQWSTGAGNWARVPWVAFLDSRETTTTQRGVYPVLLFRQDLSGAYLTLAQGVTEPKKLGRVEAVSFLQGVAARVRERSPDLADAGFGLNSHIDLRADPGLGRDYEISTIAHKLYERGLVPTDEEIEADVEALLSAYDRYIAGGDSDHHGLRRLATEFREHRPYPTERDETQAALRQELAGALSAETLALIERDPTQYDALRIGQLAGRAYGNPGPQSRVHSGVIEGGDEAKRRLARALRYLLYSDRHDDAQRVDHVLDSPEWNVYGLGESLVVKCLAIVYPDRGIL